MNIDRMNINGWIEITHTLDPTLLHRLLLEAYRASRRRPVALVFPPEAREAVEAGLDEAVARIGVHVCGVFFMGPWREEAVALARRAPLVIATSAAARLRLGADEIPYRTPDEGVVLLESGVPAEPPRTSAPKRLPNPDPWSARPAGDGGTSGSPRRAGDVG